MEITKVEAIPITIPWDSSRVQDGETVPGSEGVLIKLHTDEGVTGIGEIGHTDLAYTSDSQESILGFIKQVGPEILVGADPTNYGRILSELDEWSKYSDYAMAVIDCALYDLIGKKLDIPVYELLGGLAHETLELGWVIGYGTFDTPEEAAHIAKEVKDAGYKSAKLKVGRGSVEEDLACVEAIRDTVGYDLRLGVDANGTWDYFDALRALRQMEEYDILLCEQPVPWDEPDNLRRLRQQVDIPICADESATQPGDVLSLIEDDAVDSLFIKLAKVGGIRKGQKWLSIAEAAGLPVMMGSMVGSGFETAWQAHFLFAHEWMGHMEQENVGNLIVHDQFESVENPITDDLGQNPGFPKVENGYMHPPEGPGLGVELNEDLLAEYACEDLDPVIIK